MYLYIIRHGEPDYVTDTLTENGKLQAQAVAKRLDHSKIDEIYSSPMGRAKETAAFTAELKNLPINIENWASELGEECKTTYPDGVKKTVSAVPRRLLINDAHGNFDVAQSLENVEPFGDGLRAKYKAVADGLDGFTEKIGFVRTEDGYYSSKESHPDGVALFCHCGMTRMIMSHIFHVPYHYVGATLMSYFTGVTVLEFSDGEKTLPSVLAYGDIGHYYTENLPLPW